MGTKIKHSILRHSHRIGEYIAHHNDKKIGVDKLPN